jgi:L-arabinose isomerase
MVFYEVYEYVDGKKRPVYAGEGIHLPMVPSGDEVIQILSESASFQWAADQAHRVVFSPRRVWVNVIAEDGVPILHLHRKE